MKKRLFICAAVLMIISALVSCSEDVAEAPRYTGGVSSGKPVAKVVVNFEGTVTNVNENEITLENGKVIVITDDTVFAGDPDTNNAVSTDIAAGNFIQGYTEDDPENERLSAHKIYCNIIPNPAIGKIVVNFEGKITAVGEDTFTLDDGSVIHISDDTVFSVPSGKAEGIILSEGYAVQGYAEDSTASRIHITSF